MSLNTLALISSDKFDWNGNHGYTNASEMPSDIGLIDSFGVRSERTGTVLVFNFVHANTEPDGTVVGWVFDADDKDNFVSITIWNDYHFAWD